MSSYEEVDGVSIPIEIRRLQDQGLTELLRGYTPERLIDEMSRFSQVVSSITLS